MHLKTRKGGKILDKNDIIKRVAHGDIEALGELFELYKSKAFKTVFLITGNFYTSEDIVQEAFVKCYYSIGNLKNVDAFDSWFYRLLVRSAWKHCKKDKKAIPVDTFYEKLQKNDNENSINEFLKKEQNKSLYEKIEKLDIKQKTVIILYYFNELSVKEIAKVTGCFEGTVKSRLFNGRKNLKQFFEKDLGEQFGRDITKKKECELSETRL